MPVSPEFALLMVQPFQRVMAEPGFAHDGVHGMDPLAVEEH